MDAVKVHIHENLEEHTFNEAGLNIAAVDIFAAQSFTDISKRSGGDQRCSVSAFKRTGVGV